MAVETNDDLLDFLELDDFATTATYTPAGGGGGGGGPGPGPGGGGGGPGPGPGAASSVIGIFDNPQATRNASDLLGITIPEPRFVCRTSDVPNAADGDALTVNATNYTIRVVLTDGVGMTTLVLEKA
jgi:hypothetical protein